MHPCFACRTEGVPIVTLQKKKNKSTLSIILIKSHEVNIKSSHVTLLSEQQAHLQWCGSCNVTRKIFLIERSKISVLPAIPMPLVMEKLQFSEP